MLGHRRVSTTVVVAVVILIVNIEKISTPTQGQIELSPTNRCVHVCALCCVVLCLGLCSVYL